MKCELSLSDCFCSTTKQRYNQRNVMIWRGGRVVECTGLEIRHTGLRYRGFKSHPLRHKNDKALIIQALSLL